MPRFAVNIELEVEAESLATAAAFTGEWLALEMEQDSAEAAGLRKFRMMFVRAEEG